MDTHCQLVLKNSALIAVNAYPGGDPIFCAVRVILLLLNAEKMIQPTKLNTSHPIINEEN